MVYGKLKQMLEENTRCVEDNFFLHSQVSW